MEILLGETETDQITGIGSRFNVIGVIPAITDEIIDKFNKIHRIDDYKNVQTSNGDCEITELFVGDLINHDELVDCANKLRELLKYITKSEVSLNTTSLFFDYPEENVLEIHSQE